MILYFLDVRPCICIFCEILLMCAISDLADPNPYPYSKVVDVFDSATGTWSIMSLSVRRSNLAAAAIGSVAIFAGGLIECKLLLMKRRNAQRDRGFYVACSYLPLLSGIWVP